MIISLCNNCLETGAYPVEVGPPKGNQYDSYRDEIYMCNSCRAALLSGDFQIISERFRKERTINVGTQEEC